MANVKIFVRYTNSTDTGKQLFSGMVKPTTAAHFMQGYGEVLAIDVPSQDKPVPSVEAIYKALQSEFMSSSIRSKIQAAVQQGVASHTSMSVGDLVVIDYGNETKCWYCDWVGFKDYTSEYQATFAN